MASKRFAVVVIIVALLYVAIWWVAAYGMGLFRPTPPRGLIVTTDLLLSYPAELIWPFRLHMPVADILKSIGLNAIFWGLVASC